MTPDEIMTEFSLEGVFPKAAMRAATAHREVMTPIFIELITRLASCPTSEVTPAEDWQLAPALHLLAEWREPKAYKPFLTMMQRDEIALDYHDSMAQISQLERGDKVMIVIDSVGNLASKKEVEDLYQSISNYALVNGLTILNLKKNKPDAVGANASQNNTNTNQNNNNAGSNPNAGTLYYKIPVDYQISGNFIGYLKFRQSLSKSNKHINFDKEQISIIQNNSSGAILADGTISIVGLPNEFK